MNHPYPSTYKENNMSKRTMGYILIGLGVVGLVVSMAADYIGIGRDPGIHGTQLLGVVISLVIAGAGVWLARSKTNTQK
jgi:hypothetical protein